jgi:hypothetical protein
MNVGKTLFAQLMEFLPWSTFARIVARYGGEGFCSAFLFLPPGLQIRRRH